MIQLRPYQEAAVQSIQAAFRSGKKKVLLQLPTGAGKTVIFVHILQKLLEKNKRGILVVKRRDLVDQAAARLQREGVPHGFLMAGRKGTDSPLHVCSIDTMSRRRIYPPADLVVIDEAHDAGARTYKEMADQYPRAFFLAVTATPYQKESIRHIAETIVAPIDMTELIKLGHLVPPKYFMPEKLDLTGVGKIAGDYNQAQLENFMSEKVLVGNIVDKWQRLGGNRATICFAVGVDHSKRICADFISAGIPSEHMDADTTNRREILGRLERGETKVITNCGILGTGIDIPSLGCIILARPTASVNLYLQQLGRGTRPYPGKTDFIVLDHANNVIEHFPIDFPRKASLDGQPKSAKKGECPIKTCPECYSMMPAGCAMCSLCGHIFKKKKADENVIEMELLELTQSALEARLVKSLVKRARENGYKAGYVFRSLERKFNTETAQRLMPYRLSKKLQKEINQAALQNMENSLTRFSSPLANSPCAASGNTPQESEPPQVDTRSDLDS